MSRRSKSKKARWAIHSDSPTRKRAQKMSTGELLTWAESISMNMNYWCGRMLTHPTDGDAVYEATEHNDVLCAILLEIQARQAIGVA